MCPNRQQNICFAAKTLKKSMSNHQTLHRKKIFKQLALSSPQMTRRVVISDNFFPTRPQLQRKISVTLPLVGLDDLSQTSRVAIFPHEEGARGCHWRSIQTFPVFGNVSEFSIHLNQTFHHDMMHKHQIYGDSDSVNSVVGCVTCKPSL